MAKCRKKVAVKRIKIPNKLIKKGDEIAPCPKCGKQLKRKSIRDHIYSIHTKGGDLHCVACHKKLTGERSLKLHISNCAAYKTTVNPGRCPVNDCEESFISDEYLDKHVKTIHSTETEAQVSNPIQFPIVQNNINNIVCPLLDGAKVCLLPKACANEDVPGFRRSVRIELSDMSGFRSFPYLVSLMYKNNLDSAGAIIVRGPPNYRPSNTMDNGNPRLNELFIKEGRKYIDFTKSTNAECYLVNHGTVKIRRNYVEHREAKMKLDLPDIGDMPSRDEQFWKKVESGKLKKKPYVTGMNANGFDDLLDGWNLENLQDDAQVLPLFYENGSPAKVPGLTTSQIYIGELDNFFIFHSEDFDLGSVNYLHEGSPKVWWVTSPHHAPEIEKRLSEAFPDLSSICPGFLRHKICLVNPKQLDTWGIPYNKLVQHQGDFVVLASKAYHEGYNQGWNCAQAINYTTPETYRFVKCHLHYACHCTREINPISLEPLIKKYEPTRIPEFMDGTMMDIHPIEGYNELVPVYNDLHYYNKYYENHEKIRKKKNAIDPETGKGFTLKYKKSKYHGPVALDKSLESKSKSKKSSSQ